MEPFSEENTEHILCIKQESEFVHAGTEEIPIVKEELVVTDDFIDEFMEVDPELVKVEDLLEIKKELEVEIKEESLPQKKGLIMSKRKQKKKTNDEKQLKTTKKTAKTPAERMREYRSRRKLLKQYVYEDKNFNVPSTSAVNQLTKTKSSHTTGLLSVNVQADDDGYVDVDNETRKTKLAADCSRRYRARKKIMKLSSTITGLSSNKLIDDVDDYEIRKKKLERSADRSRRYRARKKMMKLASISTGLPSDKVIDDVDPLVQADDNVDDYENRKKKLERSADRSRRYRARKKMMKVASTITGLLNDR